MFFRILHIISSGNRTVSHDLSYVTKKMIEDKVLSDERKYAYATTIEEINRDWLDCEECDWYKSEDTILSEARIKMYIVYKINTKPSVYLYSLSQPQLARAGLLRHGSCLSFL